MLPAFKNKAYFGNGTNVKTFIKNETFWIKVYTFRLIHIVDIESQI